MREVADELGIDPFQFSRSFKRVHGVSPAAFIKIRGS
ncbi:MAG: helix-turn-helix transcriptional regulator [Verrucomicrobiia bacterium]